MSQLEDSTLQKATTHFADTPQLRRAIPKLNEVIPDDALVDSGMQPDELLQRGSVKFEVNEGLLKKIPKLKPIVDPEQPKDQSTQYATGSGQSQS